MNSIKIITKKINELQNLIDVVEKDIYLLKKNVEIKIKDTCEKICKELMPKSAVEIGIEIRKDTTTEKTIFAISIKSIDKKIKKGKRWGHVESSTSYTYKECAPPYSEEEINKLIEKISKETSIENVKLEEREYVRFSDENRIGFSVD